MLDQHQESLSNSQYRWYDTLGYHTINFDTVKVDLQLLAMSLTVIGKGKCHPLCDLYRIRRETVFVTCGLQRFPGTWKVFFDKVDIIWIAFVITTQEIIAILAYTHFC